VKAYVITIRGHAYSEGCASRCIDSAAQFGVEVERFDAVAGELAVRNLMESCSLRWTWPAFAPSLCMYTGLKQHVYRTHDHYTRMGCALSHFLLWQRCIAAEEPILILEHDAVFLRGLPALPEKFGAIMLNNPKNATPRGAWWKERIEAKGEGVHEKTVVFEDGRPDGLAGNSAYVISSSAARTCVHLYERIGMWPNDATLCRQMVPGLMEVYPFVTEVRQEQSTTSEGL